MPVKCSKHGIYYTKSKVKVGELGYVWECRKCGKVKMKPKTPKMKPVKAWAIVSPNGVMCCYNYTIKEAQAELWAHDSFHIVHVEIKEVK